MNFLWIPVVLVIEFPLAPHTAYAPNFHALTRYRSRYTRIFHSAHPAGFFLMQKTNFRCETRHFTLPLESSGFCCTLHSPASIYTGGDQCCAVGTLNIRFISSKCLWNDANISNNGPKMAWWHGENVWEDVILSIQLRTFFRKRFLSDWSYIYLMESKHFITFAKFYSACKALKAALTLTNMAAECLHSLHSIHWWKAWIILNKFINWRGFDSCRFFAICCIWITPFNKSKCCLII